MNIQDHPLLQILLPQSPMEAAQYIAAPVMVTMPSWYNALDVLWADAAHLGALLGWVLSAILIVEKLYAFWKWVRGRSVTPP